MSTGLQWPAYPNNPIISDLLHHVSADTYAACQARQKEHITCRTAERSSVHTGLRTYAWKAGHAPKSPETCPLWTTLRPVAKIKSSKSLTLGRFLNPLALIEQYSGVLCDLVVCSHESTGRFDQKPLAMKAPFVLRCRTPVNHTGTRTYKDHLSRLFLS